LKLDELNEAVGREVAKVVAGQTEVVEAIVIALAARGHVLLEGVPGVAKTLIATATARAFGLDSARVQFTPDMLPSDLTGTMTLRGGELSFRPGPVFTNLLIADEINRTPPKTQAALLESMQEAQVSIEGEPEPLPDPFCVVATQNPVEYEGTYPLPEAQLDRFLLKIDVGYPDAATERAILSFSHDGIRPADLDKVTPVAGAEQIAEARADLDATLVADEVAGYMVELVRRTRDLPAVSLGASPRAAVHLLAASRARARLGGRDFVTPDDVAGVAAPVLRHRLVLAPEAALERYSPDDAVAAALSSTPVPR
jgi:MoxR-like ATPase